MSNPSQTSIPGKQLSVLPIGLAVFGGLSLVTLVVVGIVTYERRKYRRQFRERKRIQVVGTRGYGGLGDGLGGGTGFDGTGLGAPGAPVGGVGGGGVRMGEARI